MNEEVRTVFNYNSFTLNKNFEGISHEDSLKSPKEGGNCMNWVIGHIIVTRDHLHEILGLDKMCNEKITDTYIQGSNPVTSENAEDIKTLLEIYNESQKKIMAALQEKDYKDDSEKNKELAGLGFHEAYHVGQTGVLRRIAGKEGAIQ